MAPHIDALRTDERLVPETILSPPALGDFVVTDGVRLFRVTPGGVVTIIASGVPFSRLVGVAVDGTGNFIVADFNGMELFRVTPVGVVTSIASGLGDISGVAIDRSGNFITVRFNDPAVLRITPAGAVTTIAEGPPFRGLFNSPAIDSTGDIIVTDFSASALFRVTPGGSVTTIADGSPFRDLNGVVIDAAGDFIVSDRGAEAIFRVTADGTVTTIASGPPLDRPDGIGIDGSGDFIVPDLIADALFRVTPGGRITSIASGPPLERPSGVAVVRCSLDLTLNLTDGTLNLEFELGTLDPVYWNLGLLFEGDIIPLWSIPRRPAEAPTSISVTVEGFPEIGPVRFLTTLLSRERIICFESEAVDTGPLASNPTARELRELFRRHAPR